MECEVLQGRALESLGKDVGRVAAGWFVWKVPGIEPLDKRLERCLAGVVDRNRFWILRLLVEPCINDGVEESRLGAKEVLWKKPEFR